jgi:plastocyanin
MSARRRAVCCSAAAVLALAACSNTESAVNRRPHTGTATASTVAGVQTVTIEAGDDYRFHPSTIVVHRGTVKIILKHTGTGGPHDWSLTGFPADFVPVTAAGQTSQATFVAPSPGKYQFVCTIHAKQGQTGTLVVKP